MIEFTIRQRVGKLTSRAEVLDFRKANISVLRRLVSEALKLKSIGELGSRKGGRSSRE